MLYVTLGVSLLLLAGANLLARYGRHTKHADGVIGGLFGPLVLVGGCLFTSPVVLIQAAGLVVLGVLKAVGWGRWFGAGTLAVTAGAWLAAAPTVWDGHREFARLRKANPFERIADRLPPRAATTPAFDLARLAEDEADYDLMVQEADRWGRRNWQLKRLHDERVELFVNSPGFGQVRMITRRPDTYTLGEDPAPVPQPTARPTFAVPLDRLARNLAFDFTRPADWGYRRGELVTGFRPHAVRQPPAAADGWTVERVELVGLLLAPDPRVYVSDFLPRMAEVASAPTRPPDGFESPALGRLRAGEELVHDGRRLLGAVRAARQCVECHGGQRGDLLGAMSYRLRPQ